MYVSINHKRRVNQYFKAWKNHDVNLLKDIFTKSAKYIIRRKVVYNGLDEIVCYWEKNKKRQKNLILHWKIINSSSKHEIVEFSAHFWDNETEMYTKINGQIIFKYDSNDRITRLTESYRKRNVVVS